MAEKLTLGKLQDKADRMGLWVSFHPEFVGIAVMRRQEGVPIVAEFNRHTQESSSDLTPAARNSLCNNKG